MIGFLFSFFILPVVVTNSLPFEGYGILLVDLYDQPLSLPITDQEPELDVIMAGLEQSDFDSKEITIGDQEMESLVEIIDLLSIISEGYKNPMIGIEMQLYKMDNGFRQNLVSMNMIVDPSDEVAEENYSEEGDLEKSDSDGSPEEFFVDVHHTYSPYDRLVNSYYGANSASFLPMNMYRSFLAQSPQQQQQQQQQQKQQQQQHQQQWNMLPYDSDKLSADYWKMIFNQENLEIPSYPKNYPSEHSLNTYNKPSFPTLEDALRMYDMEMRSLRSEELYDDVDDGNDDDKEQTEEAQLDVDEEHQGIFSSFGNFFRKIWRVLID